LDAFISFQVSNDISENAQEYSLKKTYLLTIVAQQQHSSHEQLGHSFADGLFLHSSGRQPQSAHFT